MAAASPPSRHLLLHGPPGAGKLTVARAVAERYDVRVLDNHVSLDPALRLFDFGTPELFELVERLRVTLLDAAARAGLDVVSTLVYAGGVDDAHVARLIEASERHGGVVTVVQLLPTQAELERRVVATSRSTTEKITDVEVLRRLQGSYDLTAPAPGTHLTVDNSDVDPVVLAGQLADLTGFRPR